MPDWTQPASPFDSRRGTGASARPLATYTIAGGHLDNALRNLRVLTRQASIALERDDVVPAAVPQALLGLADGIDALGPAIAGEADLEPVREAILDAVATAAAAPAEGLFTAPMVAQIRLSASDLLQATDMTVPRRPRRSALSAIRRDLSPPEPGPMAR